MSLTLVASVSGLIEDRSQWGLALLFVLIMLESVASQGALSILAVIVVAALAAITGDNLAYVVARKGGRRVLRHYRFTRRYADKYLPRTERFFAIRSG